uniref:hypothetical protein n=1 Tax=Altererythrobacter segetis TaxID=1104773 RepID=UPI00140C6257|nr:hypothetical protein [Altererythrobacter segetis]
MADQPRGTYNPRTLFVVIVVVLATAAAVLWATGFFAAPAPPPNTRMVDKVDVKDESGGTFIVTDPNAPGVKVTVPTVTMTDVPATPKPAAKASPAAK